MGPNRGRLIGAGPERVTTLDFPWVFHGVIYLKFADSAFPRGQVMITDDLMRFPPGDSP